MQKELTMFQRLNLMAMVLGPTVLKAVDKCLEFAKKHGEDNYDIATFGTWVLIVPKGAKNTKLDAVLAVEMVTESIFIDAEGMYGPKKTAKEAYEKHQKEADDRKWNDDSGDGFSN